MAIDERFLADRHRRDLMHLTSLARNDLAAFLFQVRGLPVAEIRDLLIQVIPDMVDPYISASGDLAATWYEDLRRVVGARGTFYTEGASTGVQTGRANALARWAVGPLAGEVADEDLTLSRLGGAVQRMIYDASRGVVEGNAVRDPVRVGYQRMARGDCCAFCGMLASRGAVYRSAETAGGVVGRGSTRSGYDSAGNRLSGGIGGGVKARGLRSLGGKYHDDCHCVAMPVFAGTEIAEIARLDAQKWDEKYRSAVEFKDSGAIDVKGTLSTWREENDTH